jgi:hypothetical protein
VDPIRIAQRRYLTPLAMLAG